MPRNDNVQILLGLQQLRGCVSISVFSFRFQFPVSSFSFQFPVHFHFLLFHMPNFSSAYPAVCGVYYYNGQDLIAFSQTNEKHFLCMVYATLQKQIGCFNQGVVTMVADKLQRQWL